MPRKPREDVAGAAHHVFARAQQGELLFRDDRDRQEYVRLLGEVTTGRGWRCLAYCLMDTHVHLVVETPEANLGAGMRELHGAYAAAYNRRHGRPGHLFQSRYGAVRARTDRQLWTAVVYVLVNPVAAGLCGRPGAWPWSSYGRRTPPPWLATERLHELFTMLGGDGAERLAAAVEERAQRHREPEGDYVPAAWLDAAPAARPAAATLSGSGASAP